MSRTHPKSTAAAEARCFRMSKELLSLLPAFLAAEQYPFDIDQKELEDHLESFMREPSVIELFEEEEVAPSILRATSSDRSTVCSFHQSRMQDVSQAEGS